MWRGPGKRWRIRGGHPAALSAGLLLASGAASAQDSLEAAVKASYLTKFAPFIAWPASAAAPSATPFRICVVGHDPFGQMIDRAVAGQTLGGQALAVERFKAAEPQMQCRIAFLGGSRAQPVKEALRVLRGAPVLTVTDSSDSPAVIDFVVSQGRVRFRVDDRMAAEDGLTISSKLLSLAVAVIPRAAPGGGR